MCQAITVLIKSILKYIKKIQGQSQADGDFVSYFGIDKDGIFLSIYYAILYKQLAKTRALMILFSKCAYIYRLQIRGLLSVVNQADA